MSLTCQPLLDALKECLLRSDCVMKQGRLPSECLKDHLEELPVSCQSLRKATFECKRNLLDMRKRFRGTNAGVTAQNLKKQTEPSSSSPLSDTSAES